MKVQDQYQIKPEAQSCQTSVMVSADYKGYTFEEDKTGYAPKHLRFHFFAIDDEYAKGAGESIEDCKQQIDEL